MARVRILASSPRHADWIEAFGTDVVDVVSAKPLEGAIRGKPALFYKIDVTRLDEATAHRVVAVMSRRWKMDPYQVAGELLKPEHGLPVLADDVVEVLL